MALEPERSAAQALWHLLDAGERARADRFRFAADREAYVAAHGLLRTLLGDALCVAPGDVPFQTTESGKPEIAMSANSRGLRFSLSHARDMVACAVCHHDDLGVDLEAVTPDGPALSLAYRFFHRSEAALVAAAPAEGRETVFFRLWTLKEAFVKATGQGLAAPLDGFFFTLDPVSLGFAHDMPTERLEARHAWMFAEFEPSPCHRLALAIRRSSVAPLTVDARAVRLEECLADARRLGA